MIRYILLLFLVSCAGAPVDPTTIAAVGFGAKAVVNQVEKRLPKYQKLLKLPPIEICYVENENVKCKINSCKEGGTCERDMGSLALFISDHSNETYFIKTSGVKSLLSYIETYCVFKVKKGNNPCKLLLEDYKSIDKVLIYENSRK